MNVHVSDFNELIKQELKYQECDRFHATELVLIAKDANVSGGKISKEEIDKIKDHPDSKSVTIFGLTQETFEYFIKEYGSQFRYIRFFKNKAVKDWSLLGTLTGLEFLYWFSNQKIDRLWDMSLNHALKAIELNDFTRLHDLTGIERAKSLEWFGIGNEVWPTAEIDSFRILKDTGIKRLDFFGKTIRDMDLTFLPEMKQLECFNFPTNLFTTEQVAWMKARCPSLKGWAIKPYVEYMKFNEQTGKQDKRSAIIVGKRKPVIEFEGNEKRIEKYINEFDRLIEQYRNDK